MAGIDYTLKTRKVLTRELTPVLRPVNARCDRGRNIANAYMLGLGEGANRRPTSALSGSRGQPRFHVEDALASLARAALKIARSGYSTAEAVICGSEIVDCARDCRQNECALAVNGPRLARAFLFAASFARVLVHLAGFIPASGWPSDQANDEGVDEQAQSESLVASCF